MTETIKAIAEVGNTALLAYLLCVLAPRALSACGNGLKWIVEVFVKEQAASQERTLELIRTLSSTVRQLALHGNGGAVHRPPEPPGSPSPAAED